MTYVHSNIIWLSPTNIVLCSQFFAYRIDAITRDQFILLDVLFFLCKKKISPIDNSIPIDLGLDYYIECWKVNDIWLSCTSARQNWDILEIITLNHMQKKIYKNTELEAKKETWKENGSILMSLVCKNNNLYLYIYI